MELLTQELDPVRAARFLTGLTLVDDRGQIVARWRLDDDKDEKTDRQQGRDHDEQAPDDVGEHAVPPPIRSSMARSCASWLWPRCCRSRRNRVCRCRNERPDPSCKCPAPARC